MMGGLAAVRRLSAAALMSAAAAPTPAASSALAAIARAEMAPSIEVTYCEGFHVYIYV